MSEEGKPLLPPQVYTRGMSVKTRGICQENGIVLLVKRDGMLKIRWDDGAISTVRARDILPLKAGWNL